MEFSTTTKERSEGSSRLTFRMKLDMISKHRSSIDCDAVYPIWSDLYAVGEDTV